MSYQREIIELGCAGIAQWNLCSKESAAEIAARADARIAELETDLELARAKVAELTADNGSMLRLLTDIRSALGDDGKRMQSELVEYCKELRARSVRLRAKVNAILDAVTEHASRAAARRVFAAVKAHDAARAGNGGEG